MSIWITTHEPSDVIYTTNFDGSAMRAFRVDDTGSLDEVTVSVNRNQSNAPKVVEGEQ